MVGIYEYPLGRVEDPTRVVLTLVLTRPQSNQKCIIKVINKDS